MQNVGMSKFGIMIMSGFAAIWFVWGLSGLGSVPAGWLVLPVVVSGGLMAMASRIPVRANAEVRRRVGKVVGWASGIEGVTIFAAVNVLHWAGLDGYAPVAAAAIVGLHFVPLGYFLGVRGYYVTGAALVTLALGCCAVADDGVRTLVVGVGAAVLLWGTCVWPFGRKGSAVAVVV